MCTEAHNAPQQEKNRQKHFINLIPSENFTSQAVLDALGSVMQSTFVETLLEANAHT
jgi:glycine hydroxymethyltransferase